MSLQAHADAVLARLRQYVTTVYPAAPGAEGSQKAVPDDAEPPYVTAQFHREYGQPEGIDAATTRYVVRAILHCVGADAVGARAMSQLAADALLDHVPTIANRSCFPIRHEQSVPPRDDETTGRLVVDLTEVYRLETVPA